jgi:hypothetical protein
MREGLNAVHSALDAVRAPLRLFLRDDDGGWDDARLFKLLDCTAVAGVPIDLAVIPQSCSAALAHTLCARIDAAPALIGVHQHGYAHTNHEPSGRKCEFGAARDVAAQAHDLQRGRERLHGLFGTRLDGWFTPPWNRCSPATPGLLAALGYSALSRDRGAPVQRALPEVAVNVDWCKQRAAGGDDAVAATLAQALARRTAAGGSVGVMLHHAVMDARDLQWLRVLLAATAGHPKVRWVAMNEVLASDSESMTSIEEIA